VRVRVRVRIRRARGRGGMAAQASVAWDPEAVLGSSRSVSSAEGRHDAVCHRGDGLKHTRLLPKQTRRAQQRETGGARSFT
jgi:hypothetical protein